MKRLPALALGCLLAAGCSAASAASVSSKAKGACEVASEYVRLIAARQYDKVGDLWADDAVFYSPMGVVIRGKTAITEFYARFLPTITPENRIASLAWDRDKNVCTMELQTRSLRSADGTWKPDAKGDFVATALDRSVLNAAGKVQQMTVYLAPDKRWVDAP